MGLQRMLFNAKSKYFSNTRDRFFDEVQNGNTEVILEIIKDNSDAVNWVKNQVTKADPLRESLLDRLMDISGVKGSYHIGCTALGIACIEGNKAVAEILIDKGAKVDGFMADGRNTPLSLTDNYFDQTSSLEKQKKHKDIILLLLKNGANPDEKVVSIFGDSTPALHRNRKLIKPSSK